MNIIFILLILFTSTLTSCTGEGMKKTEDVLSGITNKTINQIKRKHSDMDLIGVGRSVKDDVINQEKMVFNVYRKLSKKEGVGLIKEIVDLYLSNVTSEKQMVSYLEKYPFTYINLEIHLHPYTPKGDDVFHPDIAFFSLDDGIIYFMTINEKRRGIVSREKLSYNDALLFLDKEE